MVHSHSILVLIVGFIFVIRLGTSAPSSFNNTDRKQARENSTVCCNATCFEGCDAAKCRSDTDCAKGQKCCYGDCIKLTVSCQSKTEKYILLAVFILCVCYVAFCFLCSIHPECPLRRKMEELGWQSHCCCDPCC